MLGIGPAGLGAFRKPLSKAGSGLGLLATRASAVMVSRATFSEALGEQLATVPSGA